MKKKKLLFIFILPTFLASVEITAQTEVEKTLDKITSDYWDREQKRGTGFSTHQPVFPEHLNKGTQADFESDAQYFSGVLNHLKGIHSGELSDESQTNYDLMVWIATMRLERTQYYDQMFPPITPYHFFLLGEDKMLSQLVFERNSDGDRYLRLLHEYAEKQRFHQEKLASMGSKGVLLPRLEVEKTIGFLKGFHKMPSELVFFVKTERLLKLDSFYRKAFQAEVATVIEQEIIPAFDALATYLEGDYLNRAPETVGLGQYPKGKEYYKFLIKWHTTTNLSPEAIFDLGQQNVAQIRQSLDSMRRGLGFVGDMKAFYQFLQKDSRFLAKTSDEVGALLKGHLRKMEAVIPRLISVKPKAPYDVRRLPLELEPSMTFGYYHAPSITDTVGVYLYNGSKLDQRSLVSAASLAFHEIMPGHHWQINIQGEDSLLPAFRKNLDVNAYSEGWGDYASSLGTELGLYSDPYDYCGRLVMDMFLSVRLVVDVGMNYQGWSLEQATDYMKEHVIESEEQIKTERIRYSCDIPGQALGYKMGCLQFWALRHKYETALGKDFSVVVFHDRILKMGALPLGVLEKELDRTFMH